MAADPAGDPACGPCRDGPELRSAASLGPAVDVEPGLERYYERCVGRGGELWGGAGWGRVGWARWGRVGKGMGLGWVGLGWVG